MVQESPGAPEQQQLPNVPAAPPPEPNLPWRLYRDFLDQRAKHIAVTTDVALEQVQADEELEPGYVAATIAGWLRRAREEEHPDPEGAVLDLFEAYYAEAFPAKARPPWPFRMLASPKVWEPRWQKLFASGAEAFQ